MTDYRCTICGRKCIMSEIGIMSEIAPVSLSAANTQCNTCYARARGNAESRRIRDKLTSMYRLRDMVDKTVAETIEDMERRGK